MFKDYKDLVVRSYKEKLAAEKLSYNLADPTPAKLRNECLFVYTSRYDKKRDSKTLEAFFEKPDEHGDYHSIIYNFKVSRFRPLAQFLRDPNREPNAFNIELLAWLIDYQPRPFRYAYQVNQDDDPEPDPPTEPEPSTEPAPPAKPEHPTKPRPPAPVWKERIKKHQKETAVVLLLLGLTLFLLLKMPPKKQCMYWSGDRYEAVDCNQQLFGVQSIALDTFKLNHFKKITKPDTMTAYSVGKVWCVQIGDVPDCFTTDGNHPLYPGRELKKLSLPILRKYFGAKLTDSLQDQSN
ncbi:hypothetical protein [Pedobacter sp. FW305-3-2-15-E-R2A2]|uniref:hypothetical protein n=1 Tax=Pedobacter sp. FW305-3-2-15-E-R2A2 TaxID=3140251 RepID=UPI0031404A97